MNTTTQDVRTTQLAIDGMTCGHCVQAVTKTLSGVPGVTVKSVAVGSAVIETVDGWATSKAINALDEAGYPAKAMGDAAGAEAPMPARSSGGCSGGANRAQPDGGNAIPGGGLAMLQSESSEKTPGGCCR